MPVLDPGFGGGGGCSHKQMKEKLITQSSFCRVKFVFSSSTSAQINKSNVVWRCLSTLIDNNIRHHNGQNVVRRVSPQQILTTVMTNIGTAECVHNKF